MLGNLTLGFSIADIISVVVVVVALFYILRINEIRRLLPLLLLLIVITLFGAYFKLELLSKLSNILIYSLPVVIAILFKEDIKERLIDKKVRASRVKEGGKQDNLSEETLVEFSKGIIRLSREQEGALLIFNKGNDLSEHTKMGIDIGALRIGEESIYSIFSSDSLLGNGAVLIEDEYMTKANIRLPETKDARILEQFGGNRRFLGAFGLVEQFDVVVVLVSQTTGVIGLVYKDKEGRLQLDRMTNIDNVTSNLLAVGHIDLKRTLQRLLNIKVKKVETKNKNKNKNKNNNKNKTKKDKLSKEERKAIREREREERRKKRGKK